MKTNLTGADLTLPVPAKTPVRPTPLSRPTRAVFGYDASGVIDTVEISGGSFQAMSANSKIKNSSLPKTPKGANIDIWA